MPLFLDIFFDFKEFLKGLFVFRNLFLFISCADVGHEAVVETICVGWWCSKGKVDLVQGLKVLQKVSLFSSHLFFFKLFNRFGLHHAIV